MKLGSKLVVWDECSLKLLLLGNDKIYGANSWSALIGECSEDLTGSYLCGYFACNWWLWYCSVKCCSTQFQLRLSWTSEYCDLWAVSVHRPVDGFCYANSPWWGRIQGKWRRKRANSSEEAGPTSAKKHGWSKTLVGSVAARKSVILTRNNFAPQRLVEVESVSTAADGTESGPRTQQQLTPVPKTVGRPPPTIVTVSVKLLKFQGNRNPLWKYIRVPNHQKSHKGGYKGHGRLFCANAPPWRS
jgi:hypothetical protein